MPLDIIRVPVLSDNYAWLIHDPDSGTTVALDPGEADPVIAAATARGWRIDQVWTTHWHPDHTGGNAAIRAQGATVTGPAAEAAKIPTLDRTVTEGDVVTLGAHAAQVMTVPGHTQGHIAFHFADDAVIFTGDTLFAMGCGRLFEGTPADMFANMQRYAALPDETRVYCGHEYTQSNGRYALVADRADDDRARTRDQSVSPRDLGRRARRTACGKGCVQGLNRLCRTLGGAKETACAS
jgi:hydroxyacylglutathione hydrolase